VGGYVTLIKLRRELELPKTLKEFEKSLIFAYVTVEVANQLLGCKSLRL